MPAARLVRRTLLACGGIVGNLQALQSLLRRLPTLRLPSSQVVITGDIAAYCADGAACAALIRKALPDALIVRGNCERTLGADDPECGCGFAAGSVCSTLSAAWYRHAQQTLDAETKAWFAALPPRAEVQFGGRRIAVIHGGSAADNTFLFASSADKAQHLAALAADAVIAGHCGIPFTQQCGAGIWHNSGALGMPANDGTARVWYSLWEEAAEGIRITHCPLEYDHAAAAAAMQKAGLPPDYQQTLSSGIWPSDSILPPAEKQQQGQALPASVYMWKEYGKLTAVC